MKEALGNCGDSAAKHLCFRGERAAETAQIKYEIPNVGDYILYNEVEDYHPASGKPRDGERGVGQVCDIYECHIYVNVFKTPYYTEKKCFQIKLFTYGFFQWRKLKDKVYTGIGSGYSWYDLDLSNPHKDIYTLFDCAENKIKQARKKASF